MLDLIRSPCFDSALPGYAQHERPPVCPERSVAKSKGERRAGQVRASSGKSQKARDRVATRHYSDEGQGQTTLTRLDSSVLSTLFCR